MLIRRLASSFNVPPEILAKLPLYPRGSRVEETSVRVKEDEQEGGSRRKNEGATSDAQLFTSKLLQPQSSQPSQTSNKQLNFAEEKEGLIVHEIDRKGKVVGILNRGWNKGIFCTSLGLLPRDVRKLDGTLKEQIPLILVRESAILVHMEPIRAIIKHDGLILFENSEYIEGRLANNSFLQQLSTRLSVESMPFEFAVMEAILQFTLQQLSDELREMQPRVEEHLKELENIVHWERLRVLLMCRKRVTAFHEKVVNIRSCLKELLESDADMADMYLSAKHASASTDRPACAHEEMELLLENYLKMTEELASRTGVLMADMQATEDIVNIALVGQRNELVLFDLRLGIGTFAASVVGCGASVLGMNLTSGMETSPIAFYLILGTLLSTSSLSFVYLWRRMASLLQHKVK